MLENRSAHVARQIVVGLVLVVAAAAVEILAAALVQHTQRVTPGEFLAASVDIIALYAPLGLVFGVLTAPVVALAARARWLRPLGLMSFRPRALFRRRPRTFARLVAGLLALVGFFAAVTASSHTFATQFHEPWLAAWANAAAVVAIGIGCGVGYSILSAIVHRAATLLLGPLASVGVFALVLVAAAVGGVVAFVTVFPEFFLTYPPGRIAGPPVALLAGVLLSLAAARLERRRPRRVRAFRLAALGGAAFAVAGVLWVGLTYGHDNRVRHVVEDRTIGGGSLVRVAIRMTDLDGDGFSFAFGGADCDDANAAVYPGAPDPPGDGVDADCFAGDGGPVVAELGDGHYGEVPAAVPRRPNFLFVSVDALRPDHLGFNGYGRPTSRNIDAFAESAFRFDNAYSQSTRSIRSMSSMFTGLFPSEIQYGEEIEWTSLAPVNITLAERLVSGGYGTAASIGSTYFQRSHGFFQGFQDVVQRVDPMRSGATDNGLRMLDRLAETEAPWMVWIHLMNVHSPYLPDGRVSRFGPEIVDYYDEEVILADQQVGRILDRIEDQGLEDDTVVVLFSDHGEAFGEHGVFGHTTTLYEEELRATLLIRVPGLAGGDVEARVGLIDVFATVMNLARLPVPRMVASRSVVPLITEERDSFGDRELIAEILPNGRFPFDRKAILRGRYKLHWWVREGRYQLFDLEEDPGEERDLSSSEDEVAQELLGRLRSWASSRSLPQHQRREALRANVSRYPPDRIEHLLNVGFQGAFTVLGCDVDESELRPGGTLAVQCYWRVDEPTTRDYQMVVEAAVPPGHPRLHHLRSEHYPVGGRYMTSEWEVGEIIRDHVELTLPDELQYDTDITVRLQVRHGRVVQRFEDGRTTIELDRLRVPPNPAEDPPAPLIEPAAIPDGGADAAP